MTSINSFTPNKPQANQSPVFSSGINKPTPQNMGLVLSKDDLPNFVQNAPIQRTLIGNLQAVLSALNSVQSAISTQAGLDRSAGVGVFEGARNYSQAVRSSLGTIQRHEGQPSHATKAQSPGRALANEFGAYAQEYMMGRISREALTQVGQRLGIDVSSAGFNDLANTALDYISGRTSGILGRTSDIGGSLGIEGAADSLTGNIGATAGKIMGAAGAAYSVYNIADNWGRGNMSPVDGAINGASAGAYIGSMIFPGVGTAVGAVVGGVVGAIGGIVKVGKHPDQKMRDQVRHAMQDAGMLDKDWNLTLANGAKFDIGRDGHKKIDSVDGSQRAVYQLDFNHPLVGEAIGMANPLAKLLTGGDEKLSADFVGYFVNAALSNANTLEDARANMAAIFQSFQMAPEQAAAGLEALHAQGKVTAEELPAFINGVYSIVS